MGLKSKYKLLFLVLVAIPAFIFLFFQFYRLNKLDLIWIESNDLKDKIKYTKTFILTIIISNSYIILGNFISIYTLLLNRKDSKIIIFKLFLLTVIMLCFYFVGIFLMYHYSSEEIDLYNSYSIITLAIALMLFGMAVNKIEE